MIKNYKLKELIRSLYNKLLKNDKKKLDRNEEKFKLVIFGNQRTKKMISWNDFYFVTSQTERTVHILQQSFIS